MVTVIKYAFVFIIGVSAGIWLLAMCKAGDSRDGDDI